VFFSEHSVLLHYPLPHIERIMVMKFLGTSDNFSTTGLKCTRTTLY